MSEASKLLAKIVRDVPIGPSSGNDLLANYGRVSTEELAKGDSVEHQLQGGRRFASKNPDLASLPIEDFPDPGFSGFDFDRPSIQRILSLARAGRLKAIIVRDVKRFARNTSEGLVVLDELKRCKVRVKVYSRPHLDFWTSHGRDEWTRLLNSGELERADSRDNSIHGQTLRATQGKWKGGPCPEGFSNVEGTLTPVPESIVIVARILELYAELHTPVAVLEKLNDEGITEFPPKQGGSETKTNSRTRVITRRVINDIVRNPVYFGYVPGPREVIYLTEDIKPDLVMGEARYFKGLQKPVVSAKVWQRVCRLIEQSTRGRIPRAGKDSSSYLLQGLVNCVCCGEPLNLACARGKFRQYKCRNALNLGRLSKCTLREMPARELETAVIRFLSKVVNHPELLAGITNSMQSAGHALKTDLDNQIGTAKNEISGIQEKISTIRDRLSDPKLRGTVLSQDMVADYERLTIAAREVGNKIYDLQTRLEAIVTETPNGDRIAMALKNFEGLMNYASQSEAKGIISRLISRIGVDRKVRNPTGVAASSLVAEVSVQLSSLGVKLAVSSSLSDAPKLSVGKALAPMKFTFEVRRGGTAGNSVHLLDPFAGQATILKFDGPTDVGTDGSSEHPIWILEQIQKMQSEGMLKKDIAAKLKYTPPMVTYHLELTDLPLPLVRHLKTLPANILRRFDLKFLRMISAIPADKQAEEVEKRLQFAIDAVRKPESA